MFVSIGREEEDSSDSPDQGRLVCRKTRKLEKKRGEGSKNHPHDSVAKKREFPATED